MSKKILLIIFLFFLAFFCSQNPNKAKAQLTNNIAKLAQEPQTNTNAGTDDKTTDQNQSDPTTSQQNPAELNTDPFYEYVSRVFQNQIVPLSILGAMFMFIYGGIQIIFSEGDATKITAGKDIIWGTIIGLVMILLATVILGAIDSDLLNAFRFT